MNIFIQSTGFEHHRPIILIMLITTTIVDNVRCTHLMNMNTPVGSIALDMPFHDAIMLYFCLAVSGSRGSGGPGLGGSSSLSLCFPPRSSPDAAELASLPRSQPIRAPNSPPPGAAYPCFNRGRRLRARCRLLLSRANRDGCRRRIRSRGRARDDDNIITRRPSVGRPPGVRSRCTPEQRRERAAHTRHAPPRRCPPVRDRTATA